MTLVTDALTAFAPDDMAQMKKAVAIAGEADRMEGGLRKLEQAFFTAALADRAEMGHVDVNAPLFLRAKRNDRRRRNRRLACRQFAGPHVAEG